MINLSKHQFFQILHLNFSIQIFLIIIIFNIAMDVPSNIKKSSKQRDPCVICMTRGNNCKTIECSHQFCYRCLSKWGRRKGTCPLCRQKVRKIQYKKKIIEPQYLKIFDEDYRPAQLGPRIFPQRVMLQPLMLFNWNSYLLAPINQIPIIGESRGFQNFPVLYNFY